MLEVHGRVQCLVRGVGLKVWRKFLSTTVLGMPNQFNTDNWLNILKFYTDDQLNINSWREWMLLLWEM